MKTTSRKIGLGLIALAITQVLLAGCATSQTNIKPEDQASLDKYEQRIQRADGRFGL